MTDAHKRRSPESLPLKLRLAARLQPLVSKLSTEQVRLKLGDGEGSGALRRDLGDIKSGRPERIAGIGFERLLYMCHRFSVDPIEALTGVAAPSPSVH